MKIGIGSDHAGFALKQQLRDWLMEQGHEVTDVGTESDERTDYPIYGAAVGRLVASGEVDAGVAVCGSGQGICMAANKIPGVRGGVIRDVEDADLTRRHNNANVACFGGRITATDEAIRALEVFLSTPFEGGRHEARVEQLSDLDQRGRDAGA
jgi:ribose 5-phosphate isomerase B